MSSNAKNVSGKDAAADPVDTATAAVGHLYEAKERLKDAAVAAGSAVKSAASTAAQAARDDLKVGKEAIADPLHDVASATRAAASEAKAAASAEIDVLVDKSKELWTSAEGVIRKHPVAAFGAALAAGWLIAKMVRRG